VTYSKYKYPKELLETTIKDCRSVAELLRKLGIRETGGSHGHISRKLREYDIDTSHLLGKGACKGKVNKNKRHYSAVLINRYKGRRQYASRLRRAMTEASKDYKCKNCNNNGWWQDKKLILEIHHENGNWLDDRLENLNFVCPNCHSQINKALMVELADTSVLETDGVITPRPGASPGKRTFKCIYCPKLVSGLNRKCKSCTGKLRKTKINWPSVQELRDRLEHTSYLGLAKELGVTDNAIRHRLQHHD
jgi:hypothetical protein